MVKGDELSKFYDYSFPAPKNVMGMSIFMSKLYLNILHVFSKYEEFKISYSMSEIDIFVNGLRCITICLDLEHNTVSFDYDVRTPVGDACVFHTLCKLKSFDETGEV